MSQDKKPNYHHGDLRAALVQEGLALLEARKSDDIGLREVARAVGVSATAVYRHFPDKAALLQALAAEGLARLATAQKAAFEKAGGGKAGFWATGRAYVQFALDNPALFRLVFSSAPDCSPTADPATLPEAFRMLRENAASLLPSDAPDTAVDAAALEAWAKVHGLAVLVLDGMVPRDDPRIALLLGSGD